MSTHSIDPTTTPQPRILEVRTKILKKNDELARRMRAEFRDSGVFVVNLVSSPGTGKTTFLKETLRRFVESGDHCCSRRWRSRNR